MGTLYETTTTGSTMDRDTTYNEITERVETKNSPLKWSEAFSRGAPAAINIDALAHARAHELLVRMGSELPLWTGVIMVQHEYLLRWGGIEPANTTKLLKEIRRTLQIYAKVVWKNR